MKIEEIKNLLSQYKNTSSGEEELLFYDEIVSQFQKLYKDNYALTYNDLWLPQKIENQKHLSKNVIDFICKWDVDVGVISYIDFDYLDKLMVESTNKKRLITFGKKLYGIDAIGDNKDIYFSEHFIPTKSSVDAIALHELAHIIIGMHPNIINESSSPLYTLWYLFLKRLNIDHKILTNERVQREIIKMGLITGYETKIFNSFDDYIANYTEDLIKIGIVKSNMDFSYKQKEFIPNPNWLLKTESF